MIIGITGKKHHGKDTLGKILVDKYNYKKMAFADNLKEACRIIFGLSDEQLYGDMKETNDEFWKTSPRNLFQYIGTDMFRNMIGKIMPHVGNDIWIKSLEKNIIDSINNSNNIVITDVRFPNEAMMIKKHGGIIIKIVRPDANNIDNHISECLIDDIKYDIKIINDNDVKYLDEQLEIFFNHIKS